jgi:hypothetical protein
MVVVGEATLVKDDVGTPVRKRARIQLDFIGKEDLPRVRQGDDTTKAFGIVILLRAMGRGI